MYAAMLIDMRNVSDDGKTAYERHRWTSFRGEVPEFGESIWYLKSGLAGKDQLDERWEMKSLWV